MRATFAAALIGVFALALLPTSSVESITVGWDKANHVLAFAVLAGLGRFAYPGRALALLAGLLVYGALIELAQGMTPDRTAQHSDIVADAVGIAIGWGVSAALRWGGGLVRVTPRGEA